MSKPIGFSFNPFFLFFFSFSAVAVLLVAPLLCDGEPNPSRGGGGGGGRGGGGGGGEYTFFASFIPIIEPAASKTAAALSFELKSGLPKEDFEEIFSET